MGLLDIVAPFPWTAARETITRELGASPFVHFEYISERPFAAGSLAQIHLARLHDHSPVAVKVLRPDIEARIDRDLKRARRIARVLEAARVEVVTSPSDVVAELTHWLHQEVDLSIELANMRRLYDLLPVDQPQRVPRPFPEYSSRKVLTAEYIRGIPLTEVLRVLRSSRHETLLDEIDPQLYAERLVLAVLTQIFRYRFFHADLHPGNLLLLPGNIVGFVDFGLCDQLDPTMYESQLRYLSAIYSGESERIFRALTEILIPGRDTDIEAFRRDFMSETRRLEADGTTRTGDDDRRDAGEVRRSPIAAYLIGLMRSARRNRLHVPARILSMYRALLTVETIAGELGAQDSLRRIGRRFFGELQRERLIYELSDTANLESMMFTLINLKRQSPGQVSQILTELAAGSLSLRMQNSEAPSVIRAHNRRTWMIAVSILAVTAAILLSRPALPAVFGVSLAWPLGVLLVCCYLEIWRQWRRLQRS
jgi:ubiquinone biosynthesis protein